MVAAGNDPTRGVSGGGGSAVAVSTSTAMDEDPDLVAAIAMSLSQEVKAAATPAPVAAPDGTAAGPSSLPATQLTREELRAKRLAKFDASR